MKRFHVFIVLVFLVLALVTPAYANAAIDPLVVDLIAGQNKHSGAIKIWDDGKSLYILYETIDPWCLTETHLAVASSLADIPQANGNPIPGQFLYKNTHNCVSNFLYKIPLPNNSCTVYVATHAVVKGPSSTETA